MPKLPVRKRIRRAREARGWSRATLARSLGIHPRTVENWELGVFNPNPIYRQLVEKLLDVDLSLPTDPPKTVSSVVRIGIVEKQNEK